MPRLSRIPTPGAVRALGGLIARTGRSVKVLPLWRRLRRRPMAGTPTRRNWSCPNPAGRFEHAMAASKRSARQPREFGGAEFVLLAPSSAGEEAVLGLSSSGAAVCITDGKGKQACVIKWAHQTSVAYETCFDLHKDSLPVLGSHQLSVVRLREQTHLHVPAKSVPPGAAALVAKAIAALA